MAVGLNRKRRQVGIIVLGVIGIATAWGFTSYQKMHRFDGTENYTIVYPSKLDGWISMPHSPQTLFLFQNRKQKLLLRGAVSQIISEVNPTPDLTTQNLAKYYVDRTKENMPEWTASQIDNMIGADANFSAIMRQRKGKTVVTAFCAKGNTTLMVTVSSDDPKGAEAQTCVKDLRTYLREVSLVQKDMGGGLSAERENESSAVRPD